MRIESGGRDRFRPAPLASSTVARTASAFNEGRAASFVFTRPSILDLFSRTDPLATVVESFRVSRARYVCLLFSAPGSRNGSRNHGQYRLLRMSRFLCFDSVTFLFRILLTFDDERNAAFHARARAFDCIFAFRRHARVHTHTQRYTPSKRKKNKKKKKLRNTQTDAPANGRVRFDRSAFHARL